MTTPLPAPRLLVVPALWVFVSVRTVVYYLRQRFVAEPLFKAYCAEYGQRVRTGVFVHFIQGNGRISLGDDVHVDGKCSFHFSSRYVEDPVLRIGDRTGIGHGVVFVVGRGVTIGEDGRIGPNVYIFDTSGHPSDPAGRLADLPAPDKEVREVVIGNNVWIGTRAIIFPGVTIGDGSVVSAGAVVMSDVPPFSVVAGNPARRVAALSPAHRETPLPQRSEEPELALSNH